MQQQSAGTIAILGPPAQIVKAATRKINLARLRVLAETICHALLLNVDQHHIHRNFLSSVVYHKNTEHLCEESISIVLIVANVIVICEKRLFFCKSGRDGCSTMF